MGFSRLDRINSQLKKVVSEAMFITSEDDSFKNVTISDVSVTKDLSIARIKIIRENNSSNEVIDRLNKAGSFFRKIVAKKMKSLKYIPSLLFEFDINVKEAGRVLEIIEDLSKKRIEKKQEKIARGFADVSKKIFKLLNDSENVLVCGHVNPDGDAFGSISFICQYLMDLGKRFTAYMNHELPEEFRFLFTDIGINPVMDIDCNLDEFDTIVILDVGAITRTGIDGIESHVDKVINIDHHISNDGFGLVSYINPDVSSTGEILYDIFRSNDVPLNDNLSNAIYTAIYTDTGKFSYENTSSSTLAIASELVKNNADPYKIFRTIYENRTVDEVRMFAEIISTLKIYPDKKAALVSVSKEIFEGYNVNPFTLKEIVNFVRSIGQVEVAIFFHELAENTYKVSFRSKGTVDVNALAKIYGGGGHHNASGAKLHGNMSDLIIEILDQL
ncbi:30S ribosome-binding factor RbfA [bacterium]|nr:30S ribosome-binding factor RbfA [bacterium]